MLLFKFVIILIIIFISCRIIFFLQERPELKFSSHGRKVQKFGRPVPKIEGLVAALEARMRHLSGVSRVGSALDTHSGPTSVRRGVRCFRRHRTRLDAGRARLDATHQVDMHDWTRPNKPQPFFYLFKKCLSNTKAILLRLLLAFSCKRTKRLHPCTLSPPFPRQVGLSPLFLFSSPPYFFFGFCGCRFWFLNNGSLFFLLPMLKKHYSLHLLSLSCYCFSIFPVVVLLAYCRNYE